MGGGGNDIIEADTTFDSAIKDWTAQVVQSGTSFTFSVNGATFREDGQGNDRVFAGAGHDGVLGGAGDDFVEAGSGIDTVFGVRKYGVITKIKRLSGARHLS
jgi:Ca2+-binding RTX toxin-like protein